MKRTDLYCFLYPSKYIKNGFAPIFKVNKTIRTIFDYDFLCEIEDMSGRVLTVHIGEIQKVKSSDIPEMVMTGPNTWDESDEIFDEDEMESFLNDNPDNTYIDEEADRDIPPEEFMESIIDEDDDEDF
jgi:hypothetical protein